MNTMESAVYTATINLFTLGKQEKELNIYAFNRRDPGCAALLHIASIVRDLVGYKIRVNCSLIDFLWIKWKFKTIKGLKLTKEQNVNAKVFIDDIEQAYKQPGIFKEIYKEFYQESDR